MAKPIRLSLKIEGMDTFEIALNEVIAAYDEFKAAGQNLQKATDSLNSVQIKVVSE